MPDRQDDNKTDCSSPVHPRALALVLFSLSALIASAEPEPLYLMEAINHALRANRGIQLADLAANEAEITAHEAHADFDLRWGPEGGIAATGENSDDYFYGAQLRRRFEWGGEAGVSGGYRSAGDEEGGYLQFDIRQPLFRNAGRLVNQEPIVQAEQGARDARRTLYLRKMDLVIEVVRGYEAVLRYESQVEMDRLALKRLAQLYTLTLAREETGGSTRLDVLRVDLQRGEAETALENSVELLALERDDFFNLIGWTQATDLAFTPPPILEVAVPPLPEALATALSNRLDYARALDQLETAERKILIARKGLQPDLALIGRYRMTGGQDDRSSFDLAEDSWLAGIAIDPDLNRYERRAGLLRSVNQREQVLLGITDLDYAIERDIKQQIRAYHRAAANYRIALRNTGVAWKRLALAESMFRMGRGDNFSVTDAESAHAAAITTELAARAEASLSGYRLLNALGALLEIPDELKPRL